MSEKKKAQIMLLDRFSIGFEMLSDEQAGKIIKSIYNYKLKDTEPDFKDPVMKFFWLDIKNWLDTSEKSYQEKCERNKENAKSRWDKEKANA